MLSAAEPGDRVEADEVIAQIETDKVFVSFIHSFILC
jgi:pyruvate/2-oxoglutarate dehydrogenase complex dihydrolipoamide acyltransferase (E2) component